MTIGFTYDESEEEYCLIKTHYGGKLCLACTDELEPRINAFCLKCKVPRPLDWTTGSKLLDSFIMESQTNTKNKHDAYIQWIEYSSLTNIQEMTALHHGCTHIADWLEPTVDEPTRVTLKQIVDGRNAQSFDFYQVNYFMHVDKANI